jgi:hypothetical protein
MSTSLSMQRSLKVAGAAVAPLVMVHLLRTVLAVGPAPAPAAALQPVVDIPPIADPTAVLHRPPTPEQEKALAWLSQRGPIKIGRSPMDHREPPPVVVPPPAPDPEPTAPPVQPAPGFDYGAAPTLTVTAVLTRADGSCLATINGRVYQVGDRVAKWWTITQIDGATWTVSAKCEDGRTVQAMIQR